LQILNFARKIESG